MTTTAGSSEQTQPTTSDAAGVGGRGTLVRTRHGRMIAGVASGVAGYVGVDVVLVRIAFVVLTLVGGLGIPLYLACWVLVPDEDTAQSIATEFSSNMQAWRN
ncbi:MAG TPA: PspC domain-containing protein [Streptosporangiaceae bacterium]|jgi:phage shock protein PspC (stress-responsive transcriptional regulator)|nr:PspC domain-containing protein [Streptosporangiaceae bacterium]